MQQTLHQRGYIDNNLVGINEALSNLAQATSDNRAVATNLTGTNINLTTTVEEYTNHLYTKDSAIKTMQKTPAICRGKSKP